MCVYDRTLSEHASDQTNVSGVDVVFLVHLQGTVDEI